MRSSVVTKSPNPDPLIVTRLPISAFSGVTESTFGTVKVNSPAPAVAKPCSAQQDPSALSLTAPADLQRTGFSTDGHPDMNHAVSPLKHAARHSTEQHLVGAAIGKHSEVLAGDGDQTSDRRGVGLETDDVVRGEAKLSDRAALTTSL